MKALRTPGSVDLLVLAMIGGGLVLILLCIIAGLFLAKNNTALPNWAENVLVSIATGTTLKLGDVLSTLVALATGRQMEGAVQRLANSQPTNDNAPPAGAAEAGQQVADEAQDAANKIAAEAGAA